MKLRPRSSHVLLGQGRQVGKEESGSSEKAEVHKIRDASFECLHCAGGIQTYLVCVFL